MKNQFLLGFVLFCLFISYGLAEKKNLAREVKLEKVEQAENGIVLTLRALDTVDRIQIVVAAPEGLSILLALREEKFTRPLTHDLFKNFLEQNGWQVRKILIRDIIGGAFHADIVLDKDGKTQIYDARSSDALALGLRFGAKIYVSEKVLGLGRKLEQYRGDPSRKSTETRKL